MHVVCGDYLSRNKRQEKMGSGMGNEDEMMATTNCPFGVVKSLLIDSKFSL